MTTKTNSLKKAAIAVMAMFIGFITLYTMMYGQPSHLFYRPLLLSIMMIMGILGKPTFGNKGKTLRTVGTIIDVLMIIAIIAIETYVFSDLEGYILRTGKPNMTDTICGFIYICIVIYLAGRYCGWVLAGLAIIFFVQALFANKLPVAFRGAPVKFKTMVEFCYMRDEGIFGTPLMSVISYVIPFIIFTSLLNVSGAGQVFMDLASAIAGKFSGGPAKVSIVSSGLMGTISGSAVANVVGTGSITIPMMKKTGYKPEFAGAVEAVASTGGQIMPPVMGAAAFIVAQNLAIPYIRLAAFALIPALLYYIALFFSVHQEAHRLGLKGLEKDEIPQLAPVLKEGWSVFIPLILIIVLMSKGYTPIKAALYAILTLFVLVMLNPKLRITSEQFMQAIQTGAMNCVAVAIGCAAAGIVISGVNVSGLGLKFASAIIKISAGRLWITLLLTMIIAVFLGMGVPTTAVYCTVSVLLSPVLINMGVTDIAAHLFPFYYGVLAAITPPVALASYAAAGLSGSSPSKTGWVAVKLGLAGFIIPFMFVYSPELVLQGTTLNIIRAAITAIFGVYCLSGFIIGVLNKRNLNWGERILMLVISLLMISSTIITDIVGLALFAVVFIIIRKRPLVNTVTLANGQSVETENN